MLDVAKEALEKIGGGQANSYQGAGGLVGSSAGCRDRGKSRNSRSNRLSGVAGGVDGDGAVMSVRRVRWLVRGRGLAVSRGCGSLDRRLGAGGGRVAGGAAGNRVVRCADAGGQGEAARWGVDDTVLLTSGVTSRE